MYYDGLPTSSLNLDALRSNVTIIPQVASGLACSVQQQTYVPYSPNFLLALYDRTLIPSINTMTPH